ncbi:MAG: ATP synthase F1 subunit delta [Nitrospirales bacterium]
MIRSAVSRRYARALFELLGPADVERMRAGLQGLSQALAESTALKHVVASPAFSQAEKMSVLLELGKRLGCPGAIKGFLAQLVAKHRLDQIPAIADTFGELADQAKGVKQVEVTSASALSKKDREGIQRRLGDLLRGDVSVTYQEDPRLLSGLRLQIGSTVYDSSVRNRLDTLRANLAKE